MRRLDILQELLDDDTVTEIMVNGMGSIYVERGGRLKKWNKSFTSREKLQDIVQAIVAYSNRVANESVPIVDARLQRGERVNVVMNPIAIDGPVVTIRRFPQKPISMEKLISWGSVSEEAAAFLRALVQAGYNIFISGGTGSGKTTFLNALSNYIPKDERIITIEDNAELQIQGVRNLVRLEARRPNAEGDGEITIRDLIRSSLRMRPDRIIVGEVRGEETIDMLQSLNTGHSVCLLTGSGTMIFGVAQFPSDWLYSDLNEVMMRRINEVIAKENGTQEETDASDEENGSTDDSKDAGSEEKEASGKKPEEALSAKAGDLTLRILHENGALFDKGTSIEVVEMEEEQAKEFRMAICDETGKKKISDFVPYQITFRKADGSSYTLWHLILEADGAGIGKKLAVMTRDGKIKIAEVSSADTTQISSENIAAAALFS